jgi:hypothetical protein
MPYFHGKLASLLRIFPNLATIRIDTKDQPLYLEGWLQVRDIDMLHRVRYSCFDRCETTLRSRFEPLYRSRVTSVHTIFQVLKYGRNFRHGLKDRLVSSKNSFVTKFAILYPSMLAKLIDLQDLGIESSICYSYHATTIFLKALESHTMLRRISFVGNWNLYQRDLVHFVTFRAHSLRCLIFESPVLFGSWSTTLRAMAHATNGLPPTENLSSQSPLCKGKTSRCRYSLQRLSPVRSHGLRSRVLRVSRRMDEVLQIIRRDRASAEF